MFLHIANRRTSASPDRKKAVRPLGRRLLHLELLEQRLLLALGADVPASTLADLSANAQSALSSATGQDQPAYHAASAAASVSPASPPSGYSISPDQTLINASQAASTGFTITGATIGSVYNFTVTSSAGGTPITGSGSVASATQDISGIDVSALPDGTLTYAVTLTDASGNVGIPVAATATLVASLSVTSTPGTSATVGQAYTYTVQTNAPSDDAVTVTPGTLPSGMTFDAATQTFTWTPTANQAGTSPSFSATVTDIVGDSTSIGPVYVAVSAATTPTLGSISGYLFNDLNDSGVDNSDPRLSGWTMTLTRTNNLGQAVIEAITSTDIYGEYSFTGLTPGNYTVSEQEPNGWTRSLGGTQSSGGTTITLTSGEEAVAYSGEAGTLLPGQSEVVAAGLAFGNVQPVAAVTGVSPTSGFSNGDTTVTITGTGFTGATAVDFGATAATGIVVNSSGTQITATSPAESAGSVDVTVRTPAGASATSSADRFTYLVPASTSTSLQVSASTLTFGEAETLTAAVTADGSTPSGGTVTFFNGSTSLGTATLNSGMATLQVSTLPLGTDLLTASYSGSGSFAGSSTQVGPNSIVTTVAGGDTLQLDDGGLATAAELGAPTAVTVDAAGNLFIAGDDRIREVNHATGVIATVAGGGNSGLGDGGQATNAELELDLGNAEGLAVDAAGNLFIADTGDNRIREVDLSTGIITTVAGNGTMGYSGDGGQATDAELDWPRGLAVDAAGNLYIADSNNSVVREVNHATGVITTVAGNGTAGNSGNGGPATAAELDWPLGVAVDSAGNLFIADGAGRIEEVNLTSGVITTVAGTATAGYSGDNGPATAAELNRPTGVAVDAAGDLFIADNDNNRIREVDHATGVITTIAGNGTAGFSGDGGLAAGAELDLPQGVAVDSAGDLFIADLASDRVREVNHSTGLITSVAGGNVGDGGQATAAEVLWPCSVAVDASGNIFIADRQENVIREVNHSSGLITTVAGDGAGGYRGDGGQGTAAELDQPTGVAVDSAGDLFIADSQNCVVREVNLSTGVITTVAGNGNDGENGDGGQATAAELGDPTGVAVDSAGDLFIADEFGEAVREVNLSTGIITTVAGNGTAGYLGDGGQATAAELREPAGLAVDSAGNLFIADEGNSRIREVNLASGVITTVAGNGIAGDSGDNGPGTAAELDQPLAVALDAAGDIFIADEVIGEDSGVVREVDHATGVITTTVASGLFYASGVALDGAGNLFIADLLDNRVSEATNGVAVTVVAVPTVTGVSPASGSTAGDTTITISGTGFTGATAVDFGATAATGIVVNSSGTQITATSPAESAGAVDVTVTTAGGASAASSADQFTYVPTTRSTDLSIFATPSSSHVVVGNVLTYTLMVTNNSLGTATGVTVVDTLPAGFAYSGVTGPTSPTISGNALTLRLGDLAPQGSETISVEGVVTAAAANSITNTATVSGDQQDANPANNTSSVTTPITTPNPTGTITWTGKGDGKSWSDPNNWDADTVPGAANAVLIGGGATVVVSDSGTTNPINSLQIQFGASLSIDACRLTVASTLANYGTITLAGTDSHTAYLVDTNGSLVNERGATIVLGNSTASPQLNQDDAVIFGQVNNQGTINTLAGTNQDINPAGWKNDPLDPDWMLTNSGTVHLAPSSVLEVDGTFDPSLGTIDGGGGLVLNGTAVNLSANWSPSAEVAIVNDATVTGPGTLIVPKGEEIDLVGAQVNAAVNNHGTLFVLGVTQRSAADVFDSAFNATLTTFTGSTLAVGFDWQILDGSVFYPYFSTAEPVQSRIEGADATLTMANGFINHGWIELSGVGPGSAIRVTNGTLTNAADGAITNTIDSQSGASPTNTISANVENQGMLWLQDASTLQINGSLRSDVQGTVEGQPTSTLKITGSLLGDTTNVADYRQPGLVVLDGHGTASSPQLLELMDPDQGDVPAGYANPLAYDTLQLGGGTYVALVDQATNSPDNGPEAGYAQYLAIPADSTFNKNGRDFYVMGDPPPPPPLPSSKGTGNSGNGGGSVVITVVGDNSAGSSKNSGSVGSGGGGVHGAIAATARKIARSAADYVLTDASRPNPLISLSEARDQQPSPPQPVHRPATPPAPAGKAQPGSRGAVAHLALRSAINDVTSPAATTFQSGDEQAPEVPEMPEDVLDDGGACELPQEPANWWWSLPVAALAVSLGMYAWQRRRDKQRNKALDEIIFSRVAALQPGGNGEVSLTLTARGEEPCHDEAPEMAATPATISKEFPDSRRSGTLSGPPENGAQPAVSRPLSNPLQPGGNGTAYQLLAERRQESSPDGATATTLTAGEPRTAESPDDCSAPSAKRPRKLNFERRRPR